MPCYPSNHARIIVGRPVPSKNTITRDEHTEVERLLAEIAELEKQIPAAVRLVSTRGSAELAELVDRMSMKLRRIKEIYCTKGEPWNA
jgi:hypothetical protein